MLQLNELEQMYLNFNVAVVEDIRARNTTSYECYPVLTTIVIGIAVVCCSSVSYHIPSESYTTVMKRNLCCTITFLIYHRICQNHIDLSLDH